MVGNHVFYVGIGNRKTRPYSKANRNKDWHKFVAVNPDYKVFIVCENLTNVEAGQAEQCWIKYFGIKNLTNKSIGGLAPALGFRHSDESKRKISQNSAARTPEHKLKLSKIMSGENNPMFGKTHSDTARKSISKARTGSTCSEQTKAKMSIAHKGESNAAYNPSIFTFVKGEYVFVGTSYNFRIKFRVAQAAVSMLVTGKRKTASGWSIK